jgi:hypothetical protein
MWKMLKPMGSDKQVGRFERIRECDALCIHSALLQAVDSVSQASSLLMQIAETICCRSSLLQYEVRA